MCKSGFLFIRKSALFVRSSKIYTMKYFSVTGMERNGARDRLASLRMQENFSTNGMLEQPGEKARDLVYAPLPSIWKRSSQSTANILIPEDLHQKDAEFLLQAGQARKISPPLSLAPVLRSRKELYTAALNVFPGLSCPAIIDVRKNPL